MRTAIIFSVVVASVAALIPVDLSSSCASTLCIVGTRCVEETDKNGITRAKCVPSDKPGDCPKLQLREVGICPRQCISDIDCKGPDKCCRNACGGTSCVAPILPVRPSCATVKCAAGQVCKLQDVQCIKAPCYPVPVCVDANVRPGSCPASSGMPGICVFDTKRNCLGDFACPPNQKCCSEGCGKVCKDIINPPENPGETPIGLNPCDYKVCRPGEVCQVRTIYCIKAPCPGPSAVCVPAKDKPGVCPHQPFTFHRLCEISEIRGQCKNDAQCPGNQKCCRTRCGSRCLSPQPTLTCATMRCQRGYTCKMKLRCDKLGCFQRPVCEKVNQCPSYPLWIRPRCALSHHECSDEGPNACRKGTICCPTGCGYRCVTPRG